MKFNMVKANELLTDDLELLLREINDFCGSVGSRRDEIPKSLDDYLLYVAKTGNTVFPWQHIRPLFRCKLQSAIAAFTGEPLSMENTVYERFDLFRSAPFTIQRFSELITDPKKHYKLKEKYLFALEKAVYVVSTVDPTSPDEEAEVNGNAETEGGGGDNGVSYQELNSTFNITPSDTESVTMDGDAASVFPAISEISSPTLGISAIHEQVLEVSAIADTNATISSIPTERVESETEVKNEVKADAEPCEEKSEFVPVHESLESESNEEPKREIEEPEGTTLEAAEIEPEQEKNDIFEEIGKVEVTSENPSRVEQLEADVDATDKGNVENSATAVPVIPPTEKETKVVEEDGKIEASQPIVEPKPEELKVTEGTEDDKMDFENAPAVSEIIP